MSDKRSEAVLSEEEVERRRYFEDIKHISDMGGLYAHEFKLPPRRLNVYKELKALPGTFWIFKRQYSPKISDFILWIADNANSTSGQILTIVCNSTFNKVIDGIVESLKASGLTMITTDLTQITNAENLLFLGYNKLQKVSSLDGIEGAPNDWEVCWRFSGRANAYEVIVFDRPFAELRFKLKFYAKDEEAIKKALQQKGQFHSSETRII